MAVYTKEFVDYDAILFFLKSRTEFWSFSRLLGELYQGDEPLGRRLSEKLAEYEGEEKREAAERRVRNWLHDRNLPQNREELFKICFALELSEEKAEMVLGAAAESGFHYRNPREVIYAFCLRTGMEYQRARELVWELWEERYRLGNCGLEKTDRALGKLVMTGSIRNECIRIRTEQDLAVFLEQHKGSFGEFHNTAYRKFLIMLNQLTVPEMDGRLGFPKEREYSVEQVVDSYLRMGVPYNKKSERYHWAEKQIKKHWPSSKSVREMAARKRDVNRKTLLLLYLATEDTHDSISDNEKQMKEHISRVNLMMTECGMPLLNPHSPFDYLVLLALSEDEEESAGLKMERMVRRVFGCRRETAYIAAADVSLQDQKKEE